MINEAALLAARRGEKTVGQDELEEGIMRVIAGPEKKSRLFSEKERKITAYHEMGHALVGYYLDETDEVHKISIVSRGQALGYTISLPSEDRYLTTKGTLHGADGDDARRPRRGGARLPRGHDRRRQRPREGHAHREADDHALRHEREARPARARARHDMPFLGREMGAEPDYSDEVAREIDDEIRRVIEESHDVAISVLREHMDELHLLSGILIERETIDKDQFERLLAGEAEASVFPVEEKAPEPEPAPEAEKKPALRPAPRPLPGAAMQPPPEGAAS